MTDTPLAEREMIRTEDALAALCAELRAAGRFGLDTEFLGERTYVPKLCLVQISTAEFIALVDTLAVKDLSPLWDLVADPAIQIVLHAAREDLRLAFYGGGRVSPQNVFDTQIAAGFIGLPQYPLGYAKLVDALFGVKLGKGETRSEWDRRPLSPDQIRYARDDVRYLLPLADKIGAMLARLGRDEWMREEMRRFSEPKLYEPEPEEAYLRIRGSRAGLTARPTALLRAVAAWREREAADRDVPARSILRDEVLTELALRPPRKLPDFLRLRGFPEGEESTLGPPLLDALNAARALTETDLPPALGGPLDEGTPTERALGDLLFALGEALCLERNLAPELVLTRGDALAVARGRAAQTLTTGWRRTALGEELLQVAEGRAQAVVQAGPSGLTVRLASVR